MSILDVTSVSTRGQVVIPNEIRENMHLEPGTKLIEIGRASVGKECRSRWSPYH